MAFLFHKVRTRPMPCGAEIITRKKQRLAQWVDSNGKKQTSPVTTAKDGTPRISVESDTWYGRYKDAAGYVVEKNTECKDRGAALACVNGWAAQEEKVRAGIVTAAELNTARRGQMPYAAAVKAFSDSMTARKCAQSTVKEWTAILTQDGAAMNWRTLLDMNRPAFERYLSMRAVTPKDPKKPDSTMGARLHNAHVVTFAAFGAWCFRQGLVKANPFTGTLKRDERADRRHVRRALTAEEVARLLDAARTRPLRDAYRGNKGRGEAMEKGQAELTHATIDAMRWLGTVRATYYRLLVSTGLRHGEARSITLGACRLDDAQPHLILQARDEKARRGAQIPVPTDFVPDLKDYLAERRSRLVGCSGMSVVAFPGVLDNETLFDVPKNMSKVFQADARAAGLAVTFKVKVMRKDKKGRDIEVEVDRIDTRDSAGRVIDIHALRHTFGTMLAKAGVSLQVAQRAMRHSTPALTANVYTHLGLLDVAGAVNAMPPMIKQDASAQVMSECANGGAPNGALTTGILSAPQALGGVADIGHDYSTDSGEECVLTNNGAGLQRVALKENGGGFRLGLGKSPSDYVVPLCRKATALSPLRQSKSFDTASGARRR